jgi:hypothetical protein
VAERLAARSQARWTSDRRLDVGVGVPRLARRGVCGLRRRRSARTLVTPAGSGCCTDRVCGATRAARGAAAPLDRRLGLLGLRPHRRGSRCESLSRRARRVSERSGVPLHGHQLARFDDRLRAGIHTCLGAARPRRGVVRRRGRVDLQVACRRVRARDCGARRAAVEALGSCPRVRRMEPPACRSFRGRRAQRRIARAARRRRARRRRCWQATARRRLLGGECVREMDSATAAAASRRAPSTDASVTSASRSPRSSSWLRPSRVTGRDGCTPSGRWRAMRTTRRVGRCRIGWSSSGYLTASRSRFSRRRS